MFGDKGPPPRSFLRHLIFGEAPSPSAGSAYYYVYEHLCGLEIYEGIADYDRAATVRARLSDDSIAR
jgi:hypothetical protein